MDSWKKLTPENYHRIWDRFYEEFNFRPSIYARDWPSIQTGLPVIRFDIMECYREGYDHDNLLILEELAQTIFRKITGRKEQMLALDWQHDSFEFYPHEEFPRDPEFDEWLVPVLPNGDYYIFLTEDFKNLWFGHPWEETITVAGEEIVLIVRELVNKFNQIHLRVMD